MFQQTANTLLDRLLCCAAMTSSTHLQVNDDSACDYKFPLDHEDDCNNSLLTECDDGNVTTARRPPAPPQQNCFPEEDTENKYHTRRSRSTSRQGRPIPRSQRASSLETSAVLQNNTNAPLFPRTNGGDRHARSFASSPPATTTTITSRDLTPVTSNSRRCIQKPSDPAQDLRRKLQTSTPPPPLYMESKIHSSTTTTGRQPQPYGFILLDGSSSPPSKRCQPQSKYKKSQHIFHHKPAQDWHHDQHDSGLTPEAESLYQHYSCQPTSLQQDASRDGTATTVSMSSTGMSANSHCSDIVIPSFHTSSTMVTPPRRRRASSSSSVSSASTSRQDNDADFINRQEQYNEFIHAAGGAAVVVSPPGSPPRLDPPLQDHAAARTTAVMNSTSLPPLSTLRAAKQKARQARESRHLELRKLQAEIDWDALKHQSKEEYKC